MSKPPKRQKSIQMVDEMKEVLECPVCLKVPRRGNVYQCKRGHSICSGCHPHLTMCPICRVAMSKSPARNFAMEKLLSKVTHACKFADHGCIFEEAFGPLESHEQDCEFRLVNCISRVCETKVSLAKLLEHIEEDHKEEEIPSIQNPIVSNLEVRDANFEASTIWGPKHSKIGGQHFFIYCWRSVGGHWHCWVNMIGSKKKCDEYIFTAEVSGQDEMENEGISFSGPCVPLDYSKEKVAELGRSLIFTDAQAKRLWANGNINYHVTIKSLSGDSGQMTRQQGKIWNLLSLLWSLCPSRPF